MRVWIEQDLPWNAIKAESPRDIFELVGTTISHGEDLEFTMCDPNVHILDVYNRGPSDPVRHFLELVYNPVIMSEGDVLDLFADMGITDLEITERWTTTGVKHIRVKWR